MIDGYLTVLSHLDYILAGLKYTALLVVVGMIAGTFVGIISALALLSPSRILRMIGNVYLDIFRSTPILVQFIWVYYALPVLLNVSIPPLVAGCLVLTLYSGAFHTETFRAGILSLGKGQEEGAIALGMLPRQAMTRVILPQATVRMLPSYANTLVILVKDSALASAISVPELFHQGTALSAFTMLPLQTLSIVALVYFLIVFPLSRGINLMHRRLSV